ncbi:hypothetical protein NE236_31395 [Actinoallomurus purpureus]|uniref:hypothetical protein n=1 Tax=Actinoallomurus purpureus TaxID=478114 RepID=UPI00209400DE|nr:hypothetical protein [Actinoallomurus purpureus]MCO6009485.1 hypothetical protein [Actinoallomurus purpureus]
MRVLALPLVLLVAVLLAALLLAVFRRPDPDRGPRWEAATELRDGVTVVLVRQVAGGRELGRQVVAEIPADATDWETRYHEAMAAARSRAAALRSETD